MIYYLTDGVIFIVSHDLDLLLSACDEVLVVAHGCVKNRYPLNEDTKDDLATWFQSSFAPNIDKVSPLLPTKQTNQNSGTKTVLTVFSKTSVNNDQTP